MKKIPALATYKIDLRADYDEKAKVGGITTGSGTLYRKEHILQVWWEKYGKETWTCPSVSEAKRNFKEMIDRWQETSSVKGEQAGMLGVPGKVHTQKRPWTPGQMEFGSYGKLKAAKEQTTVPEEMKLLPNAKQNLYWWTVEQLRDECIRQGLIDPTKRYHKKELIDFLEPGLGLKPPFPRKFGQVWDPDKHIWVDA